MEEIQLCLFIFILQNKNNFLSIFFYFIFFFVAKENDIRVELSQMQSELSLAQQQLRDMRSLEERLEVIKFFFFFFAYLLNFLKNNIVLIDD